jgi:hypothetical protein
MSKMPGDFVNAEFVCHKLFALDSSSALRYAYSARLFFNAVSITRYSTKNVVFKIRVVYRDLRVHILYCSSYFYS